MTEGGRTGSLLECYNFLVSRTQLAGRYGTIGMTVALATEILTGHWAILPGKLRDHDGENMANWAIPGHDWVITG